MFQRITRSNYSKTTIIIRLMVGTVFLSEGIQKFLYPATRGAGRFEKIGLPSSEFLGTFIGYIEIICGTMILLGLLTRLASIPTLIIMLVAITITKTEILTNDGFWAMMHASRTDWAMLLGSLFLIINGGGNWSIDNYFQRQKYRSF